jgi:hypothetical protein
LYQLILKLKQPFVYQSYKNATNSQLLYFLLNLIFIAPIINSLTNKHGYITQYLYWSENQR